MSTMRWITVGSLWNPTLGRWIFVWSPFLGAKNVNLVVVILHCFSHVELKKEKYLWNFSSCLLFSVSYGIRQTLCHSSCKVWPTNYSPTLSIDYTTGEHLSGYVIFFDPLNLMVDPKKMYANFFPLSAAAKPISDKEKSDKSALEHTLKIPTNVCSWCRDEVVFMTKIGDVKWPKNPEKHKL